MPPTVSINLCCYNSEKYLKETLDSIVNQTYNDWELVIINDGSKDSTESIVSEYIKLGYPILYHYQENRGLAYSRNKALELSKGEYIAFIDHDDIWFPEKLDRQMKLFLDNRDLGLVYSDCYMVYPDGKKVLSSRFHQFYRGEVFKKLLFNNFIVLSTAVIRKDIFHEAGGFPPYEIVEEYALFLSIAVKYPADFIEDPMVEYLYHESNVSRKIETNLKEVDEIYEYWSSRGDENIQDICKLSRAAARYGLGRRALFHLKQRSLAINFFKDSLSYHSNPKCYIYLILSHFPMWLVQRARSLALLLIQRLDRVHPGQ